MGYSSKSYLIWKLTVLNLFSAAIFFMIATFYTINKSGINDFIAANDLSKAEFNSEIISLSLINNHINTSTYNNPSSNKINDPNDNIMSNSPCSSELSYTSLESLFIKLFSNSSAIIRVYDCNEHLLFDNRSIKSLDQISKPVPNDNLTINSPTANSIQFINYLFNKYFSTDGILLYEEEKVPTKTIYPEVVNSISGHPSVVIRYDNDHNKIINVAVPIHYMSHQIGALLITDKDNRLDLLLTKNTLLCGFVFFVYAIVSCLLSSLLLSRTRGLDRR